MKPSFLASLDLVAHIDLTGRVVTHQDDGQARLDTTLAQGLGARGHLLAQLLRQGDTIDETSGHGADFHGGVKGVDRACVRAVHLRKTCLKR